MSWVSLTTLICVADAQTRSRTTHRLARVRATRNLAAEFHLAIRGGHDGRPVAYVLSQSLSQYSHLTAFA